MYGTCLIPYINITEDISNAIEKDQRYLQIKWEECV